MITDLKIALRRLRRAPGFTAVAVLTLALAIGANTAVFSIADAVLFRPLPYDDPGRIFLGLVEDARTGARYTRITYEQLEAVRRLEDTVEGVGILENESPLIVPGDIGAESLRRVAVTPGYFELLGVRPARGRLFRADDPLGGGRPVVLTWDAFERRFNGDDAIVGRPLSLGGETFDVVGVLPAGFVFPSFFAGAAEIVTPMAPPPAVADDGTFHPVVRLRPDVSRAQAEERIRAVAAELIPTDAGEGIIVPVLEDVRATLYPTGRPIMRLLIVAALLVLLLGCANLANMLLARTRLREREIGVQAAIGASSLGLLRPLLFEALLLGIAGALAALATTSLAFGFLLRQVPPAALGQAPVGVDARVALFALLLGVVASLTFAAAPAWRAARLDAQTLLRGAAFGSARRASFGRPMLAAQVGLAVVLVFGALTVTRAFIAVLRVPLGFEPADVITVSISPDIPFDQGGARQAFFLRAIDALQQRADVITAGAAGRLPLEGAFRSEGAVSPSGEMVAGIGHVLPGYFDTVGIELVRGRLPTRADADAGAEIAVVSEAAARLLFPGRDPLGATVVNNLGARRTVVGVVTDVADSLAGGRPPGIYALPNDATRRLMLVVKARAHDDALRNDIRRQVSAMAPGVPIAARWWTDEIASITAYRNPRFQTLVLGSFAALALGLTALGVFGLVAFLVAARLRELGIRKAIGAGPAALVLQTLRHALVPTAVGLLAGLLATRVLAHLAAAQLYEVETSDPAILLAAAVSVAAAALLAAWLPARRAARVDPMAVLREQ